VTLFAHTSPNPSSSTTLRCTEHQAHKPNNNVTRVGGITNQQTLDNKARNNTPQLSAGWGNTDSNDDIGSGRMGKACSGIIAISG